MSLPTQDIHPVCKMRSGIVCLSLLVGFALIGCRLFYLQVLQSDAGAHEVQRQHQKSMMVQSDRGVIVDRHGHPLALNVDVPSVFVNPRSLPNPQQTAQALAPVLDMRVAQLRDLFQPTQSRVRVKRHIPEKNAKQIEAMAIPGVEVIRSPQRFYPKGELGSHIVGFAGDDNQGLEGIEFHYESFLRGEKNLVQYQRDALGGIISSLDSHDSTSHHAGYHITLSIDEVIQFIAEDELAKAVNQSGAKSGTILIMDPMTGAILAWALYPTFDPNHFRKLSAKDWRNWAVTDPYEPGSTLKVVVAAAALEENVMEPDTLIYGGDGQMPVAGTIVHDHAKSSWITFTEAVAQSSNVGVIKVALELGKPRMFEYLKAFGFGEKTGIDLSGESAGILRDLDQWSGRSLSSLAMGQEIAVTPIQMVTAMSVVANGGWLMTPRVVSSVMDGRGQSILTKNLEPKRRPISAQTAKRLGRILETVVESGTGKQARLVGYRAAGKTGTSQKVDPETGGYSSSNVIASFVGFVPVEQPRLTMLVVIDDPEEEKWRWGGTSAAPVFGNVANRVLPHLGVLPGGAQLIRTASSSHNSSSLQALVQ
jgi:cell division protein FtsI (penicillin-binding protein 3)